MNAVRLSLLAYVVLAGVLGYLVYNNAVVGVGPIAIGVQIAAAILMLWARLTFGLRSFHAGANTTMGPLVTSGPFGLVRNPIYLAILLFLASATASHPSWTSLALLAIALGAVLVRIVSEERELKARYADEYEDYARAVKRLVPFVY